VKLIRNGRNLLVLHRTRLVWKKLVRGGRSSSEATACIGGAQRWLELTELMEQTELVGGRWTDQNVLEAGEVVRALEHVASR
jgi:hypothetical protein